MAADARLAGSPRGVLGQPCLRLGIALAVGGAALAWWSQERADAQYRRYLHAAGVRRQNRALARARDYDQLAGAAFLGMEAGLALVTYVVLF